MTDSRNTAPEEQSMGRWLLETALLVALAFALAFGIRSLLVEPFIVPTGSMIPTIQIGNRVLGNAEGAAGLPPSRVERISSSLPRG